MKTHLIGLFSCKKHPSYLDWSPILQKNRAEEKEIIIWGRGNQKLPILAAPARSVSAKNQQNLDETCRPKIGGFEIFGTLPPKGLAWVLLPFVGPDSRVAASHVVFAES